MPTPPPTTIRTRSFLADSVGAEYGPATFTAKSELERIPCRRTEGPLSLTELTEARLLLALPFRSRSDSERPSSISNELRLRSDESVLDEPPIARLRVTREPVPVLRWSPVEKESFSSRSAKLCRASCCVAAFFPTSKKALVQSPLAAMMNSIRVPLCSQAAALVAQARHLNLRVHARPK